MSGPLCVAGVVLEVRPIANADRIRLAVVDCGSSGKWSGVVGLDIAMGDRVVVFLQDALLPPDDRWAFLEKQKWRIRMCRFRGAASECLIIKSPFDATGDPNVGDDLSDEFGVTKYEKPVPAGAAGDIKCAFPSFIPRTDEDNFQRVPELVDKMQSEPWFATEKADGTSCTVWNDTDGMHVCSRNYELKEFTESGASNLYWRMARKYNMDKIPATHAVQFEIVGPGVQSNPMGLAEQEIRVFCVFNICYRKRAPYLGAVDFCAKYNLPTAKHVASSVSFCALHTDDLRQLADIKYDNGKPGEGVVIQAADSSWSFKVINLNYQD